MRRIDGQPIQERQGVFGEVERRTMGPGFVDLSSRELRASPMHLAPFDIYKGNQSYAIGKSIEGLKNRY